MARVSDAYRDRILGDLANRIGSENVDPDTNSYMDVFRHLNLFFPSTGGRIAWHSLPHQQLLCPDPKPPFSERVSIVTEFFRRFVNDAAIEPLDKIVVIGDLVEVVWSLNCSRAIGALDIFFQTPQNTYVVKDNMEWCFCYTFEDDMYYGRSPSLEQGKLRSSPRP